MGVLAPGTELKRGTFVIGSELGRGGFGEVYLARQPRMRRDVAIKVLLPRIAENPEIVARFEREALAAASLQHPHVLPVFDFDFDETAGIWFLAMQFVPGGQTLLDLMGTPMETSAAAPIVTAVAGALDAAHALGIVHRDVKPANVLMDGGRPLLTDFGIAHLGEMTGMTQTGMAMGTPAYMSPEQAMGRQIGPKSDQYALAVMAYEMLAGRPPFLGDPLSLIHQHVASAPPPLAQFNPRVSAPARAAVVLAMSKDPEDRFSSCGEFAAALMSASTTSVPAPVALSPTSVTGPDPTRAPGATIPRASTPTPRPRIEIEAASAATTPGTPLPEVVLPSFDATATSPRTPLPTSRASSPPVPKVEADGDHTAMVPRIPVSARPPSRPAEYSPASSAEAVAPMPLPQGQTTAPPTGSSGAPAGSTGAPSFPDQAEAPASTVPGRGLAYTLRSLFAGSATPGIQRGGERQRRIVFTLSISFAALLIVPGVLLAVQAGSTGALPEPTPPIAANPPVTPANTPVASVDPTTRANTTAVAAVTTPQPTATPEVRGAVRVASIPDGAAIMVDGEPAGRVPRELRLIPGVHEVTLVSPTYEDWTRTVQVADGEQLTLTADLVPAVAVEVLPVTNTRLGYGAFLDASGIIRLATPTDAFSLSDDLHAVAYVQPKTKGIREVTARQTFRWHRPGGFPPIELSGTVNVERDYDEYFLHACVPALSLDARGTNTPSAIEVLIDGQVVAQFTYRISGGNPSDAPASRCDVSATPQTGI